MTLVCYPALQIKAIEAGLFQLQGKLWESSL